jgi:DNA-binding beta-propeller fold protein YncE
VLLLLFVAVALAPVHARLVPPTDTVVAAQPVTAKIVVTGVRRPAPRVRFTLDDAAVSVTGRRTGKRGSYSLRFTLPRGGAWTYRITVGKRTAGSGRLDVQPDSHLPGADARAICAGAGTFWPTETLALDFGSPWVACKTIGLLQRLDPPARLRLGGSSLIAVATGFGSVWALDGSGSGTLLRIDPSTNTVSARIDVRTRSPYNVWIGARSVWVAGDQAGEVVRIDPTANAVAAHIPTGDGAADMAFQGQTAWVINHRDRRLVRIEGPTNEATLVALVPGDAPERLALARGHLWITGRGTDLVEVDPDTGAILRIVEIGAGGIDVVASGDTLWVPSRNSEVDVRGLPTMEALRRVDARTGTVVQSIAASGRLDVHGLAADDSAVWLADNTHGVLYRVGG